MPVQLPLGLVDAPRKAEEGAVRKGRRDHLANMQARQQAQEASRRQYEEIWARLGQMGTLPGQPKQVGGDLVGSTAQPSVAPSENDPSRDMAPMGASPKLSQRDMQGDPIPAQYKREGMGGPDQGQPPQDELAAIEAELARRELAEIEAELARRGQAQSSPAPKPAQQQRVTNSDPNDPFEKARTGTLEWEYREEPVLDAQGQPLPGVTRRVPVNPTDTSEPDAPWNEQLADMLDGGVEGIMDLFTGQRDPANDPVGATAKMFVEPMISLPSSALRDPGGTALAISPPHMAARAYGAANSALIDATQGDWEGAKENAGTALMEGANAALSVVGTGLIKPKGPRSALDAASVATKQPPVREPTVREARKTLAATAVPGRPIRPQATKAIEKILINSGVPRDRIASGLTKVVQRLQGTVDGGGKSPRPLSVGAALKEEFGNEFPEVRQNIDTVRLERRLTRKRGDASPTIIRDTVQDMRGSQAEFLTESAKRNAGATTRNATRKDMEAQLAQFGEEGYTPILSQPIDAARTKRIEDVLTGPGMSELGKPLRQIAAGEGKTIEQMMQESPLSAAHWMQHKARLLAEENAGTALGNAYTSMRNRILATIDDLTTPEGKTYRDLRGEYAETAQIGTALKAGDQFGAAVRNPEKATAFVEKFEAATPAQQEAQLASIGDWVLTKVRGGGEEGAARMAELQNIAVLETLERLGAKGKAMADDIRAIRDEEGDISRFFPKSESATVSNQVALAEGPDIYSKSGGKVGAGSSALADGAMMAADVSKLPILSMLSKGREAMREIGRPRRETREDMTRVLMSRPGMRERLSALVDETPEPPAGAKSAPPALTYEELSTQANTAWQNGQWELANDLQRQANALKAGTPPKTEAPSQGGAAMTPDGNEKAALKAQGFDTDKVYYHGSDKEFDTFDMSRAGSREMPWYGQGAYLTPQRDMAKRYGDKVTPFYVRGKLLRVDNANPWPAWLQKGADVQKELTARGYVGLEIDMKVPQVEMGPNFRPKVDAQGKVVMKDQSLPEVVVFDPKNIIRADKPKK